MAETKKYLQGLVDKLKRKAPEIPEGAKRIEEAAKAAKRVSKVRPIVEE